MHYNVKLKNKLTNEIDMEEIIEAKNTEDAIKKMLSNTSCELLPDVKDEVDWVVECNEMSVLECIDVEMNYLKKEIARKYIENHYDIDNMPFREYSKLLNLIVSDNDYFYIALKDVNKYLRVRRHFLRNNDITNTTIKNCEEYLKRLHNAESEEVFNRILNQVKHKM